MHFRVATTAWFFLMAALLMGCPPPTPPASTSGSGAPGEKAGSAVPEKGGTPASTAAKPAEKETGPVAIVNNEKIPRAEFYEMYEKMTRVYTRRNKPVPDNVARRHKQNIVNRLVEKRLLQQAITAAGIKVTPEEMDEGLKKYKKMFRTEANFERYLKSSKTTVEGIEENIRFNKALDKLLEKDGPIEVTDEDMKEYFEKNKRRYEVKEMVKAGHILIRVKKGATDKEKEDASKKAGGIEKEARKPGADFRQLAIKHSEGPTGPKGGDLGFFTKGRMAPEFEKVAFAMKTGEISKPVLTQFGYHIIKVYERKEAGQKSFEEVKDSIAKLLESRSKRKRKAEMLRELKKKATIVNKLKLPPVASPAEPGKGRASGLVPGSAGGTIRSLSIKPPAIKRIKSFKPAPVKPAPVKPADKPAAAVPATP